MTDGYTKMLKNHATFETLIYKLLHIDEALEPESLLTFPHDDLCWKSLTSIDIYSELEPLTLC